MSHSHSSVVPPAPARLSLPVPVQAVAALAVLGGAGSLAWAFGHDASLAWSAYLIGMFFALGLGVFGAAWLAILYLSGAAWSVTMRRVPEAMTAWLLPGGALALVAGLGAPALYHWANAEAVAGDELLLHKAAFLNMPLFWMLVGASVILWLAFAAAIVRTSRRQDQDGGVALTRRNRALSAIFLVVFALTLSVVSFYFLMSLEAHWFSTMFAVLVFTDLMQTGTAFIAVVVGLLMIAGKLEGFVNRNHLHSLGKMVFAWTGFWAYIYFCQFMLIWYANIPEETIYFLRRSENGWLPYFISLPFLKFVVPFALLLPRDAKRSPRVLVRVSILILFAQFWELYLMVGPAIGHGADAAHAHVPLVELGATCGFLGLFTLVFGWALSRHDPVPLKDPLIAECLQYES